MKAARTAYQERVLAAALAYVERGWAVFPLHTIVDVTTGACSCGTTPCGDAGKHPRVRRGVKEASKDPEQIRKWFGDDAPPSNVGLATGEISGITVLDVDVGEGKLGAESWAEAIREIGEPETARALTGGGGAHIFFSYNSAMKTASNVLGKGIDCRNDGGYVVAAPSVHRSGGVYEWLDFDTPLAIVPAALSRRKETRGRPKKDDMYRSKYSLEQVATMLALVPADDRDLWRNVGIILGREFDRVDAAWQLYVSWASKWTGKRGRNHDETMHECFHEVSQQSGEKELSIGTIVKAALDAGWSPKQGEVPIGNFLFYGPGNNYIYRPTISLWIAGAVDAAVSPVNDGGKIIKASDWLKMNCLVTSMTCDPGLESDYVKGFDCRNGELVSIGGAALFNSYRRPTIELGDARLAQPFLEHVERVFPKEGDAKQFLDYMAHRVQRPEQKPRFALLIAGPQGVGKDTAIEMCSPAIGSWNISNIDPSAFESGFNEFVASTLIRISEAANLHEMSKWAFNERTKVLIAGSPDTCTVNPKYGQKWSVRMYCGVIITTNHLASGIYIPPDDRRYDVIETATMEEMGLVDVEARKLYFAELWDWFLGDGGASHIAALLTERDISKFSPNNGQRKTEAHATVVASGNVGDEWLDDILDELGYPQGVRGDWLVERAVALGEKAMDVKRKMSHSVGRLGYVQFRNPEVKDGRWKIADRKVSVYVKVGTPPTFDPRAELVGTPF